MTSSPLEVDDLFAPDSDSDWDSDDSDITPRTRTRHNVRERLRKEKRDEEARARAEKKEKPKKKGMEAGEWDEEEMDDDRSRGAFARPKAQVAPPMGAAEEGEEVAAPDTLEHIRLKRSKMERCAQLGAIRRNSGAIRRNFWRNSLTPVAIPS